MPDMNLAEIPLFAMLRGRLGHQSERQRVISQNVANSDTPGFTPTDLKAFTYRAEHQGVVATAVQAVTRPGHMVPPSQRAGLAAQFKAVKSKDSETTPDGNSVVLEEEMLKMAEARMNYDAAIGFYQKSLGMLRMAARSPGRG